ncbi:MAG: TcpQ domain-containing protein [Pseudomonadota bacterium]
MRRLPKAALLVLSCCVVSGAAQAGVQINPYPQQATQYQFDHAGQAKAYKAEQKKRVIHTENAVPHAPRSNDRIVRIDTKPEGFYSSRSSLSGSSDNENLSLEDVRVSALSAQRKRAAKAQLGAAETDIVDTTGGDVVIDVVAVKTQPVDQGAMRDNQRFQTASNGAAPVDLNAVMMNKNAPQSTPSAGRQEAASYMKTSTQNRVPAQKSSVTPYRWSAVEGADVQDTLHIWADSAGVDFVWNGSNGLFDVENTTVLNVPFEEAVRHLLDQYKGKLVRPYGRLFVNPSDGRRVLVVDVKRGV